MKKYVQLFIVMSVFFIYAAVANAAQWTKMDVEPTYAWNITFNSIMDEQSFLMHATLRDSSQNVVPFTVKRNDRVLTIAAPKEGYIAGERYTLVIPTAVTSVTGEPLAEEVVITFVIKEAVTPVEDELSEQEKELAKLINDYRESLGLQALPISKSLTTVARTHVNDSNAHSPERNVDSRGKKCNLHSWSANGNWSSMCYTPDHAYFKNMWDKPRELTAYKGNGYEISVWSSRVMTPTLALNLWKGSPGHEAVMASRDDWRILTTMGVAIEGKYAHVWFGSKKDPIGYYEF